ncbi:MAG: endolytic transglycosylase MltG [Eggerthellaceae bacterium]|jgi:UPF0755 protein|nr:endolytic transglycosylase MltG [Eggerthellaceae bacterium]
MPFRRQVTYSSHPTRAARSAHARGERQFRTYDTTFIQPRRKTPGPTILVIVAVVIALIIVCIAVGACSQSCSSQQPTVASGTQVSITIDEGSSTKQIATDLQQAGLISDINEFTNRVQALGSDTSLKPGSYTITAGTSVNDIISQLTSGPSVSTMTIPEGYTLDQIASTVEQAYNGSITADSFKAAAHNASAYVDSYPFVADAYDNSLEGFLFPKTYKISSGDTADSVIRSMLSQYASEISSLDYTYPRSKGLSDYDTLKLASIVEKEASSDNRSTVASVFYNRLAQGMNLQSDATIAYVIKGDPTPDDLSIDSPYNTYLNPGLPAGPICSPGLDSLKAVCSPASTDYLYFYFSKNDDGSMNYQFSQTYEEHQDAIGGTLAS